MKSCCFLCQHCDAVEKDDDLILCCVARGEENPQEVLPDHVCQSFIRSPLAEVLFEQCFSAVRPMRL